MKLITEFINGITELFEKIESADNEKSAIDQEINWKIELMETIEENPQNYIDPELQLTNLSIEVDALNESWCVIEADLQSYENKIIDQYSQILKNAGAYELANTVLESKKDPNERLELMNMLIDKFMGVTVME